MYKMVPLARIISTVFCACFIVQVVHSSGQLSLRLVSYENKDGKGDNGHCCDGRGIVCSTQCDHIFTICVDVLTGSPDLNSCAFGKFTTGEITNKNSIEFGSDISGLANPIQIPFQSYDRGFLLKIDVWDEDSLFFNSNDHVDTISYAFNEPIPVVGSNITISGRTTMEAQVSVTCDTGYYGPSCSVFCDATQGNYNCNPNTGDKVCLEGWEGEDCSIRITTTTTTTTEAPTTTPQASTTTEPFGEHVDCASFGFVESETAVRNIKPAGISDGFEALCFGEWTLIQNRYNGEEEFNRAWEDYKNGFGILAARKDFWLGLEKIYRLTSQKKYKLMIKMEDAAGNTHEAKYDHFYIDNEDEGYRLHLEGFSGDAGDSLAQCHGGATCGGMSNGQKFSTPDRDNDQWAGNCARRYKAGWWYNNCFWANLNGRYVTHPVFWPKCPGRKCINWRTIEGYENHSLLKVGMAIAPNPDS